MAMATLKDVRALALKLGARVEDEKCGNHHECRVAAPHRKVWACRGVHEMVDSANRPWKPDYDDMLNGMKAGLEDCPDAECDWCDDV